jgi:hypothetical protein
MTACVVNREDCWPRSVRASAGTWRGGASSPVCCCPCCAAVCGPVARWFVVYADAAPIPPPANAITKLHAAILRIVTPPSGKE